jgi:hypothetical protein
MNRFLIDFWSRVLKFFDIKKAPKISRHAVGVDPVELRENPRTHRKQKSPENFEA